MAANTAAPKIVEVSIPSIEEANSDDGMLGRLSDLESDFQQFETHMRSVIGEVSTKHWEGRLTSPPTVEDLGSLWLFVDYARRDAESILEHVQKIEDAMPTLDGLRLDDMTRIESGDDA